MNHAEIASIAKKAAWKHPSRLLSYADRYEAAHDGVVDAITAGDSNLNQAAAISINAAVVAYCRHYGIARSGGHTGAKFAVYWKISDHGLFVDDLTDRIAVGQVMDAIHPAYQTTLRIYAETDCSIAGTARALGISHSAAKERVRQARDAARTLMFEPDHPPLWHRKIKPAM